MRAMQQGAKAMKSIHKNMDIDQVDETMDDVREQVELSEEISEAISKPLYTAGSLSNEVDEDQLDEELELLQTEMVNPIAQQPLPNQKQKQKQNNIALPSVPNVALPESIETEQEDKESEDEDERALRELQAEMGL